uniref:Secreted protein n=1 Tax=Schistocephalus solidus TaxID=70667 RepID=A0A0X3NU35_SCHSO
MASMFLFLLRTFLGCLGCSGLQFSPFSLNSCFEDLIYLRFRTRTFNIQNDIPGGVRSKVVSALEGHMTSEATFFTASTKCLCRRLWRIHLGECTQQRSNRLTNARTVDLLFQRTLGDTNLYSTESNYKPVNR